MSPAAPTPNAVPPVVFGGRGCGRPFFNKGALAAASHREAREADSHFVGGSVRVQQQGSNNKHFSTRWESDNMDGSFQEVDRKPQASAGKCSQVDMPLLGVVPPAHALPVDVVARATFNGCLVEAARHSGLEDQEIADEIHISHGYMSRFMRGVAQQWAKRLVAFMRITRCLAPLQWIADQMGCDIVLRSAQAAHIAKLEAELAAARRGERRAA